MGYAETDVRYGHKADMLNALANGGFWGKAGVHPWIRIHNPPHAWGLLTSGSSRPAHVREVTYWWLPTLFLAG